MEEVKETRTGFIYKLVSSETDKVYIGSSFRDLKVRFSSHKRQYKSYVDKKHYAVYVSSFEIMKYTDAKIELLESGEFSNNMDMLKLERKHIEQNNVVNVNIPGRTLQEYMEKNKEEYKKKQHDYHVKNIDKIKQKGAEYRKNNKTNLDERSAKYRLENSEKLRLRSALHYERNKEKINKRNSEKKYVCECGMELHKCHKTKHELTKRHKNFITNNITLNITINDGGIANITTA